MFVFTVLLLAFTIYLSPVASAGVPRPAWDCVDDKIISKYYDEPCASEEDCFGRSMKCEDGKCACKEDYVTGERFVGEQAKQTVCVAAPSLHSECSTICQKPYVCKQHAELNKKICQCEPPFKLSENLCHLECKDNEDYDSIKYRCIPKCKANELKINDTCFALVQINDACSADKQCLPAYSECKSGKCACIDGFMLKEGLCEAEEMTCPNGQVIKSPKKCTFKKDPENKRSYSYVLIDDCPEEHFCETVGGGYKTEGSGGFCCSRVESKCPVGKPHPTARCRNSPLFKDNDKECPWDSHYCSSSQSGGHDVCCPKRCESSMTYRLYINGKCYPTARVGDACVENNQCTDSRTSCVNGVCKCSGGSTEQKRPTYTYCSVECPEGELLHDDKCHKPLSLGDSCGGQSWRCPLNSICNKFNVCSCSCPRFTLSKDVCAPVPICPAPRRHYPVAFRAHAMEMSLDIDKYYQPISEEKRRELLQNVTFCAISGKVPPKIENVQQCPEGQYCAIYINELGMCCKIPDYACPNGKKPTSVKQCSPRTPLSCGLKQYCHDYLYTADPNSPDGKLCCETEEHDNFTK